MATTTVQKTIHEAAKDLAKHHFESDSDIERIYLFPHDSEIRLAVVDPATAPSKVLSPFYFVASPDDDLPYASALALILPREERRIKLPRGWDWSTAEVIPRAEN